jgi:hypothetical protein
MPLERTAPKSLTWTLWLMSITASSPATSGRHDPPGGGMKEEAGRGGGADPPQAASDGTPRPASPRITPRREIIVRTSDCSPSLILPQMAARIAQKRPLCGI